VIRSSEGEEAVLGLRSNVVQMIWHADMIVVGGSNPFYKGIQLLRLLIVQMAS